MQNSMIKTRALLCCLSIACLAAVSNATYAQSVTAPPKKSPLVLAVESQLERAVANVDRMQNDLASNEKSISEMIQMREELHLEQDSLGVSSESYANVMITLQSQRVEIMIDLAGMDARRNSLVEILEKRDVGNGVPDVVEMQEQLLAVYEKRFEVSKNLHESGSMSYSDLLSAELGMRSAKVKLAEVKTQFKVSPRVNEELLTVSLDRAEKQARLAKIETLLKSFSSSRKFLLKTEDLTERIKVHQQRKTVIETGVRTVEASVRDLKTQLQQLLENGE